MFEKDIKDYFTKTPFDNKKFPVITDNCFDEGCELNEILKIVLY